MKNSKEILKAAGFDVDDKELMKGILYMLMVFSHPDSIVTVTMNDKVFELTEHSKEQFFIIKAIIGALSGLTPDDIESSLSVKQ